MGKRKRKSVKGSLIEYIKSLFQNGKKQNNTNVRI